MEKRNYNLKKTFRWGKVTEKGSGKVRKGKGHIGVANIQN